MPQESGWQVTASVNRISQTHDVIDSNNFRVRIDPDPDSREQTKFWVNMGQNMGQNADAEFELKVCF